MHAWSRTLLVWMLEKHEPDGSVAITAWAPIWRPPPVQCLRLSQVAPRPCGQPGRTRIFG